MLNKIASAYLEKIAKDFYNSIAQAETGSFKDPWIRTTYAPPEGSSAYGPAQLTRKKATDYFKRFPIRMAPHAKFYNNVLRPMHDNFLKYGKEPNKAGYDKKWDYGGAGNPLTAQQKKQYEQLVRTMMTIDEQEARKMLPNGTPEQILNKRIALWRGAPQKDDNRYYKEFHSVYNKNNNQQLNYPEPLAYPMEMEYPNYKPAKRVSRQVNTLPEPQIPTKYTVKRGDSVDLILKRGGYNMKDIINLRKQIQRTNKLDNKYTIKPGQQLILPQR